MITRILFILLFWVQLNAQTFNAAPFEGMGNTGIAIESIYSLTNNPAGLGNLTGVNLAIAYQPHFMTKELRTQAVYIGLPVKNVGALGFSMRNYGIQSVSSFLTANVSYARSFGGIFSTSVTANYHRYYVENYINDNSFSLDLGAQIRMNEQVNIGFLFINTTFSKFKDDTEQYLPTEIAAGFLYKISKDISVAGDTYYEFADGFNIRAGLEYSIANEVSLRGGVASNPMQYFGGIGLRWNKFQFDVSSSFHTRLVHHHNLL